MLHTRAHAAGSPILSSIDLICSRISLKVHREISTGIYLVARDGLTIGKLLYHANERNQLTGQIDCLLTELHWTGGETNGEWGPAVCHLHLGARDVNVTCGTHLELNLIGASV